MEFCEVCENMFYLTTTTSDGRTTLLHTCKKCGNEKKIENHIVSSVSFVKREQYTSVINKYTKLDPTLPRIYSLKCPNEACVNHTKVSPEIIYIRYDNLDLKYAYLCPICDATWKTDKN
jgi:DNA-directed RNA polymerase subunit M/transcription elongation factor TFIIS